MAASGTNWAGNVVYRARELAQPTTLDELRAVVVRSAAVRPLGSRHSFNRIADSDGVQVSLGAMPGTVEIDGDRRVVRVGGGLTYGQVAPMLASAGWALPNLASLPHISIAGAVQTGTHGSGARNPSLAQSVIGMEIMRADGEIETLGRDHPELDAHRVGLGALGIVTATELAIEPAFDVAQAVHTGLPWDAAEEHFDEIMGAAYSVSMFTGFADDGVRQVWVKRRTDAETTVVDLEGFGATGATATLHPVPGGDVAAVTPQLDQPGPWHARLPHFRSEFTPSAGEEIQCEYLLRAGDAVDAIRAVRGLSERLADVLYIAEIRRVAADTAWLAPSSGRDSVAIHFTFRRDEAGVAAVLPAIDDAFAPFDARPHWGKVSAMSADRLRAVYPRLADFAAVAHRVDPGGRFRNPYLSDLLD
ncbi:FAD-binding protein [Agromyces sp. Soil535]|uniref:FAD-binding protein n=1 Tax=Agromyces sp. Soil535 TaxID=1736390 RepID=UPI0006F72296|nr:FAD-binding protein [Agromyces sp. Soil535]KRE31119.1 hypothetical protein ASG80_01170 [Agromyces sp. Soil535]